MKHLFLTLFAAALSMTVGANDYDQNKPFGFCTVSSRTDASSTFNITGGGIYDYAQLKGFNGTYTILKSNGQDMKSTIQNAIKQNDVVIFDGSEGDFIVSENIGFERGNKTLLGINNARLCTKWYLTDEIKSALNAAGVPSMSTSGGGGTLPNGTTVSEEAEYNTRRIIIELTGDNSEKYRKSGIFSLNKENVIIRNITFVGPGSVDVGGYDLISATGAKHCWVDHCAFQDGMDGNFDITNSSDFITVSWCTFSYTDRSYMHQNTNLIGSSDSEATGYLNTTFAFNWWGEGCKQRMPMARVGKIHMLNNYYSSTTASNGINPRKNSEFLIDGNYFDTGVKKYYSENDATAVTWTSNNFIAEASKLPDSKGTTVTVPYEYTVAPYTNVPTVVKENAGATLQFKDDSSEGDVVEKALYSTDFSDWTKASAAQNESTVTQQTKYSHETLTFTLFNTAIMSTEDNKFSSYTTLPHMALQAAKNSDPYVTTSKLASITKVRFVHAATGSNRGWKLEAKGDGDTDWVTISNSVANPAGWCEVTANVNRTNVELRFTNLTSNQNAYMFELDIYGNVNMGGTPSLGKIKANGQTYDLSDVFEENASGDMEATVEISKTATMISESNPVEAVADNGTIGSITYAATATSCKVTIPVTANGKTLNYIINFVQKPDFTLTYIGPDGQNIGTQTVEKDAAIGTFAKNIADVAATKDGHKARGWFKQNRVGEKFTTESIITEDVNLYAVETEIEVASDSKKYIFDLTDKNFDATDHEAFNSVGSGKYYNNHGWVFSNGDKIELLVGKKASISLGLCQYSADGATITASNGSSVNAKVSTDGSNASFNYEGDAGTLTLTINSTGTVYIHQVIIQNTYTTNYDIIGQRYIVKQGDADSFLDALSAANVATGTDRVIVYLPDGTYDLGEKTLTEISRNNISIVGESMEGTIIKNRPVKEGIAITATLLNKANNTYLQDLTLDCIAPYGTGDDTSSAERGVCLQDKGNNTICKNVYLKGLQDTYYSNNNNGTFYFEDCKIEGTVDYVCGNGDVYFNNTLFYNATRSNGGGNDVIAAPNQKKSFGYIFYNCTIDGTDVNKDNYRLGRPWAANTIVRMLNTKMIIKPVAEGWSEWSSDVSKQNAVTQFAEYNSLDANGNPIDLSNRKNSFAGQANNPVITAEEAENYKPEAIFNSSWKPATSSAQLEAPDAKLENGTITWNAVAGSNGYAIFADGNLLAIVDAETTSYVIENSSSAPRRAEGTPSYTIRTINVMGGMGEAKAVSGSTDIKAIDTDKQAGKAIYTLQGVRVEKPTKGIYIIGGKKIIVK